MADYVVLMGAESVQSAGYTMRDAAANMIRAAGTFDDVFYRHQRFMDDWLNRLETILKERNAATVEGE